MCLKYQSTVSKYIGKLEKVGLITVERKKDEKKNRYYINTIKDMESENEILLEDEPVINKSSIRNNVKKKLVEKPVKPVKPVKNKEEYINDYLIRKAILSNGGPLLTFCRQFIILYKNEHKKCYGSYPVLVIENCYKIEDLFNSGATIEDCKTAIKNGFSDEWSIKNNLEIQYLCKNFEKYKKMNNKIKMLPRFHNAQSKIIYDVKQKNYAKFDKKMDEEHIKNGLDIATGNIENNKTYQCFLEEEYFSMLKKLYAIGVGILTKQNRQSEIVNNYEWLN